MSTLVAKVKAIFDTPVSPFRLHLFEWCDLSITPAFIKHRCQETLTAQWTHRLPFIQAQAPAELAVSLLNQVLSNISDIDTENYTIIDFCSGAGGPTPYIESKLNKTRAAQGLRPIDFRLSDLVPNIDAWMEAASKSENLSFIPQPVNAASPPPSVISRSAANSSPYSGDLAHARSAQTKTMHIFCLSFHHFDDAMAKQVMGSMLANSDAFAVIELQDRSLGCVLLLMMEWALLLLVTIFWFGRSWLHLLFTYCMPILPFVQTWDGVVSCLRTRTFDEMAALVGAITAGQDEKINMRMADGVFDEMSALVGAGTAEADGKETLGMANGKISRGARGGGRLPLWTLSNVRVRHTWPFGHMNAFVGIREDIRK